MVNSFAGDDWRVCRDHVRAALGLPAFASTVRQFPVPKGCAAAPIQPYTAERERAALAIWRQTVELMGTPAERYLRGRGLTLDLTAFSDLCFHASLRFEGGTTPGMVALMRDVRTNEPCGIHRTFLNCDGRKIGRKMLGRAKGACVKLSANESVTYGLGLAEGIETALSVLQAGWKPIWACLSADAIRTFPVLTGIDEITVFADRDESGTGQAAALECCTRWLAARRRAGAITPDIVGDWNDVEVEE